MSRPARRKLGQTAMGVGAVVVLLGLFASLAYSMFAPAKRTYSQATPDAVLESAIEMVKNGDARLLTKLIHADSPEMRQSLNRLGLLLQNMQGLAGQIQKNFPKEIEEFRAKTEKELAEGKTPAFIAAIGGIAGGRGNSGSQIAGLPREGAERDEAEGAIKEFIARQFSDPFGWLEQNSRRLSTLSVTDDQATVTLDGRPVGGVGIPLQLADDGKWYIKLPTGLPPLSDVLPKAAPQWAMFNSLIQLLDNTVVELTGDVREGRLRNLESIGVKAQEKVIFPGALWFAAYAGDLDARRRVDRGLRSFRERVKAWAKSREEAAPAGDQGKAGAPSPRLTAALSKIAAEELTPLIRARKAPALKEMTDAALEELMQGWLKERGIGFDLSGPLGGEAAEAALAKWESSAAAKPPAAPKK